MKGSGLRPDKTNAILALFVFFGAFVVYALTVQRSLSFWDCGEFIACSYILGIPHPPGVPLYILLGRVFSIIPFVEDISHRVNYISVLSSAFTAMFAYLLTSRLIQRFHRSEIDSSDHETSSTSRFPAYIGGIVGGFMVAFSMTNWANSVEAEVYGLSLAFMVIIAWLTVRYYDQRLSPDAGRWMVLVFFLAFLGVGMHLTVILIFPFFAIFFALRPEAGPKDYLAICGFVIVELLLIMLFANGRGGVGAFYATSALLAAGLVIYLRSRIRWGIAITIGCVSTIMLGFELFIWVAPLGFVVLLLLAALSKKYGWHLQWKIAMVVLAVCLVGFSVHLFLPVRSAQQPRINENNPSRSFQSFIDFLERKQYGRQSMVDRMFKRRGTWSHQFGRHAHMGFWSYFEEQYSNAGWGFFPFLVIGILGLYVAVRKRLELGLPFMTLFLICSVGLILYMNFADGTLYDAQTGDAYLEVRERDYFFTPAFVFFGIAIGLGVAGIMDIVGRSLGSGVWRKRLVYALGVLVLLPAVPLAKNYHRNDRSNNVMPYVFGANILDSCEQDAILFTTGDNETFTLWCLQEVYGYRTDVRVVNQALLNGDWYIEQMKNIYDVPMSLTDEQILHYPWEPRPGVQASRPKVPFFDRSRGNRTYLAPYMHQGTLVSIPQMVIDDIIIENQWQSPIYFSSLPYANSPLNLRSHLKADGVINRLVPDQPDTAVDLEKSYDLFMNHYRFTGFEDPQVYRADGVTRDFMVTFGIAAARTVEEALRRGERGKAMALMQRLIETYPEHWQIYIMMAQQFDFAGDSTRADSLYVQLHDTMAVFAEASPDNRYLRQNYGIARYQLGYRRGDPQLMQEGIELTREAFLAKPNDPYMFRQLAMVLSEQGRNSELREMARVIGKYKRNLQDPIIAQILGINPRTGQP